MTWYTSNMLHEDLRSEMQKAMKAKDSVRLNTLRMALTSCTNALVEAKKKPDELLEDDEVIKVLKRLVKQRKEAAGQYRTAGQEERASAEDRERAVLEGYLPKEMAEEEVREIVARIKQDLGVSEKKDTGTLMKAVMAELKGKADGSTVAKIAGELLE